MSPKHLLIEGIQGQSITSVLIKDKKPKTNQKKPQKTFYVQIQTVLANTP